MVIVYLMIGVFGVLVVGELFFVFLVNLKLDGLVVGLEVFKLLFFCFGFVVVEVWWGRGVGKLLMGLRVVDV